MENEIPPIDEHHLPPYDEPPVQKEPPFMVKMGFLALTVALGMMIGAAIMIGLGQIWDFDLANMLLNNPSK